MKRGWILGSWGVVGLAALIAVILTLNTGGTVRAATEIFGPPEAEVTMEDDYKIVHLTSSKFLWQFRDDQEPVEVWGYNEQIPGPTLRFRAGDKLRIYYRNDLDEASTIHWHGLIVPNSMDGVGLLTSPPIMPGETLVYEFDDPEHARDVHVPRAHERHGAGQHGPERRLHRRTARRRRRQLRPGPHHRSSTTSRGTT